MTQKQDLAQSVNDALEKSDLGIIPVFRQHKKRLFLAAYLKTGMMTDAQKLSGVHRSSHFNWYKEEGPEGDKYRETFDAIMYLLNQDIDDEIFRRGMRGVNEPVWYRGKVVGRCRKFDTTLLIFLAKARMKKYRDEPAQITQQSVHVTRQEIREELARDPEYLEFLRHKAMQEDAINVEVTDTKVVNPKKALPKPGKNGTQKGK